MSVIRNGLRPRIPWWSGLPILLLLSSCTITIAPLTAPDQRAAQTIPEQAHGLLNTEWVLTALGNLQTAAPVLPSPSALTLTFSADGQVQGSNGCTTYSGRYTVSEEQLSIEALPHTTSTCTDPQAVNQAEQFLAALYTAQSFSLSDKRLAIWYEQRRGMLTFTAATAVTPTPLVATPTATVDAALAAAATPFPYPSVDASTAELPATATPALLDLPMQTSPLPTATGVIMPPPPGTTDPLTTQSPELLIPIAFTPGVTTTTLTGTVAEGMSQTYTLQAQQSQTLILTMSSQNAGLLLRIRGADGAVLKAAEDGSLAWTGQLPASQAYLIDLISTGPAATYTLQVNLTPAPADSAE